MTDKRQKPNLFIVGAMKSATTSLHNYLDLHPEVFMSKDPWKEPGFFVRELNLAKGMDWYLSLFSGVTAVHKVIGESTTDYTKRPNYDGVAERIFEFNPAAKIIYIMRDPIERSISHYWWEVAYSSEGRDMLTAMRKVDWISNTSNYAMQLKPYLDLFKKENVYTLTTEALSGNPDQCLSDIFRWLGVKDDFKLPELGRHNESRPVINQFIGARYISWLRGGMLWNAIKKIVPAGLRRKILAKYTRPVERNNDSRDETIRYLQPIMREQVAELSDLLGGRQFPEWETLYKDV